MADSVPSSLKQIAHFIKIASELRNRDPAVYYWCVLHAIQTGMQIDKKSPDCQKFLAGLLTDLETIKKENVGNEAITNEIVGQAHVESYAIKLFTFADSQDRAGVANKNIVKAFYTASVLFDVLAVFGQDNDDVIANHRKYAKWKAAYIHNCLRSGETPIPGPPQNTEYDDQGTAGDVGVGYENAASSLPDTSGVSSEVTLIPSQPFSQEHKDQPAPTSQSSSSQIPADSLMKAQKLCKHAANSIEYEDIASAVGQLQEALSLLTS